MDAGFVTTPALFDGHCKVNDGTKDCVDGFLKFSKVPPRQGNFKLFIDNVLDSQGECNLHEKVTGSFSAHLLNVNAVFKGTS